ncbi:hypothetical protein Tco_1367075 [Tanacetum coccineum]
MGIVRFRNYHFAVIMRYGDYVQENIMICHVYYIEGLGHYLFLVRKFCDGDLEVAFRLNMCYVRNIEGEDLLTGSRDSNLYTISNSNLAASSPALIEIEEFLRCENRIGQGLTQILVNMGVSYDLRDLFPSFVEDLLVKGVGLRMADSYTGNHREDDFTPLETIRSAKDSITIQTCELSQEEFNDFLALYPIPPEYGVMLPKSNQTIFDAPSGYVGLYTHSFSLSNLRLPLTKFFCEVL